MPSPSRDILVLNDFGGKDANVVRDYLYCFNQHSRNRYFYLHSWSKNGFRRLNGFDFNRFDAIILFWDFFWVGTEDPLSYCYVPDWVSSRIAESRALKIQFLQDEYRDVRLANRVMSRFGVNLMFSCVATKDQELFYPKALIPSLIATYPVLTGYVPSYLESVNYPAAIDRPIDIGYRSRRNPYYLGSLSQEKVVIAERFQQVADRYGFTANISVEESSRIYGSDWLTFMKACRFSLGTESGASVVDFDGQIRKTCQAFMREHPGATFEEAKAAVFAEIDGKVVVQTISPRIFEASAFENTLILHEGRYEGMLLPDVHYISVKKDYSNIAEVVERMRDRPFCERLAKNAKDALINSKRYNYRSFVKTFDEILEGHIAPQSQVTRTSRTLFYLMNYLNNDRLMPHGGVCLTIPHTCDAVYHYNRLLPYAVILWCSLSMIVSCVSQSPQLMAHLLLKLLLKCRTSGVSCPGLLKDLRILALFIQWRGGWRASHCPPLEFHLLYRTDTHQLIMKNVPTSNGTEGKQRSISSHSAEQIILESVLARNERFAVAWDNSLLGNGLPLPIDSPQNYCIYLDESCVYRFECLNSLPLELNDEEGTLVKHLLLGGWRRPSWSGTCLGFMFVCWITLRYWLSRLCLWPGASDRKAKDPQTACSNNTAKAA